MADWGVTEVASQKIKKQQGQDLTFTFAENPDILVAISKPKQPRPELVSGVAAESEHDTENARVKLEQKGCDWIVANDVLGGKVFDSDDNTIHLITRDAQEDWPSLSKQEVAERLADKIATHFS